jgi:hypothetical protein
VNLCYNVYIVKKQAQEAHTMKDLLITLYTKANAQGGAEEVALAVMAVDVLTQKYATRDNLLEKQIQELIESYS